MNWVLRYVARVGHVWVENPLSLLAFSLRLGKALLLAISRFATPAELQFLYLSLRQTVKAFVRGIVAVLGMGAFVGFGLGTVTAQLGEVVRPEFEAVILPALLREVMPLVLAVVLTARAGATIAAKFASSAALKPREALHYGPHAVEVEVIPQIVATTITSGIFFFVLACCVGVGCLSGGTSSMISPSAVWSFLSTEPLREAVNSGITKSLLYGAVLSYVASAFGIQAAERFISRREEAYDLHYAVWESSVTSITLCVVMTILFWKEV